MLDSCPSVPNTDPADNTPCEGFPSLQGMYTVHPIYVHEDLYTYFEALQPYASSLAHVCMWVATVYPGLTSCGHIVLLLLSLAHNIMLTVDIFPGLTSYGLRHPLLTCLGGLASFGLRSSLDHAFEYFLGLASYGHILLDHPLLIMCVRILPGLTTSYMMYGIILCMHDVYIHITAPVSVCVYRSGVLCRGGG